MMGMSLEDMRAKAKENAARSVRVNLALEAVANAEDIQVTDEEVEAEVEKLSDEYSMEPDQVRAAVSTDDLKHDLRNRKAVELIVSTAQAEKPAKKATKRSAKKDDKSEESETAEETEQSEE
jgi:trigger factor